MSLETIEAKVKADLTWIQKHERLCLAVVGGLVLWFAVGKIDTLIQNHDHATLQQAQVIAAVQEEKNVALAKQVAEQAAEYKKLADTVNAQNAALEQANVNLVNALIKQQHTDATLPPSDLVARWNTLVPQAGATVVTNGVLLPEQGAVSTVQALEQTPVLQKQLGNTQDELKNAQGLLTASNGQVITLNTEVGALRVQIVDNSKVCDARVKVESDRVRKARRRWFVIGYVAGFLSRQYIKSAIGF